MEVAVAPPAAVANSKTTIRVCTHFFKGNKVCLQRCIRDNGWLEETEEASGRSVYMWFGNHVNHYTKSGDMGSLVRSRHMRSSRFDGMRVAAYKVECQQQLEVLRSLFPKDLPFVPRAWVIPEQGKEFYAQLKASAKKPTRSKCPTFIVKPSEASQGTGIFLCQTPEQLPAGFGPDGRRGASFVAQDYVDPPLLLDGFKFDLRLYVLVVSVDPLRCYLHKEGMARLCSEPYQPPTNENMKDVYSHLTNYSLNKKNENYAFTRSNGSNNNHHGSKDAANSESTNHNDSGDSDSNINSSNSLTEPPILPQAPGGQETTLSGGDVQEASNGRGGSDLLDDAPSMSPPPFLLDSGSENTAALHEGFRASNLADSKATHAAAAATTAAPSPSKSATASPSLLPPPIISSSPSIGVSATSLDVANTAAVAHVAASSPSTSTAAASATQADASTSMKTAVTLPAIDNLPRPRQQAPPVSGSAAARRAARLAGTNVRTSMTSSRNNKTSSSNTSNTSTSIRTEGAPTETKGAASSCSKQGKVAPNGSAEELYPTGTGTEANPYQPPEHQEQLRAAQRAQCEACGGAPLIYVNYFADPKDYAPFPGLYPTIAVKIVERRPFKTKKELYDGLDPGECARWKKHEHRVSLADPQFAPSSDEMAEIAAAAAASAADAAAATPLVSPPRSPLRSGISVAVAANKFKNNRRRESLVKDLDSALGLGNDASKSTAGSVGSPAGGGVAAAVAIRRSSETMRRSKMRSDSEGSDRELLSGQSTERRSSISSTSKKAEKKGDGEVDEEEPEDTGVEDGDGDPSSKRRLKDVLKQLHKEVGLKEADFWDQCKDLAAKIMIAIQPSLAMQYRCHFPRKRRRAGQVASSEEEDDESEDDDDEDSDEDRAAMAARAMSRRAKAAKGASKLAAKRAAALHDPLRPKLLDEPPCSGEDGEDSFRCFHILGIDVLLDADCNPHFLEINSNPSLNINHDARDEHGVMRSEVSPVDEVIKMAVMKGTLGMLTRHDGTLPQDEDVASLGGWMPVVSRRNESKFERFMVLERLRHVFVSAAGLKFDGRTIDSSSFQRIGRKLKVPSASTDLVFVKACSEIGARVDHLTLDRFYTAIFELASCGANASGSGSFAQRNDVEERADVLLAAVDAYFTADSDDED